ncbi:MAG: hypothetical protein ACFE9Z_02375 [Promethearchaeota archaeon]
MVNLLLLIENLSPYSKSNIDQGNTPNDIYRLSNCIKEAFCLSYSIRKENNLFIFLRNKQILIKFEGNKLKYLGPDERSQTLLLEKALNRLNKSNFHNYDRWFQSTPGIFVRKFRSDNFFIDYISSIINDNFSFIEVDPRKEFKDLNLNIDNLRFLEETFFIFPLFKISSFLKKIIKKLKDMKSINMISLFKIKDVENKILYINFLRDQQENIN